MAEENMDPEDNKALYYTLTSTKEGTPSGEIRQSMIEYAYSLSVILMCGAEPV